jgi:hypothetical protein
MLSVDRKYIWAGFLFCTIPFLAFALHMATLGGGASNAALVYLPLWISLWMGGFMFIFGMLLTAAAWFIIGLIASGLALKISPRRFIITVWIFYAFVFFVAVLLPWWPEFQYKRRFMGIGYTLEDCRKIDAALHAGNDRLMCIKSASIRMVKEKDPAVNQSFCNSIIEDDDTMVYCWRGLAYANGTSVDFCQSATLTAAKESCIHAIAAKLRDETVCQNIKDNDRRIFCIENAQREKRNDVSATR